MFCLLCLVSASLFEELRHKSIQPHVVRTDHGSWLQFRACYPPFNWSIPNGFSDSDLSLFWMQPENHRHFLDTNASDHCGVVRVVHNGEISQPFTVQSNVTHFLNVDTTTLPSHNSHPVHSNLLVLTGHAGEYFQHFFDNIGPQLTIALDALGLVPRDLSVLVNTSVYFPVVERLWRRLGFSKIIRVPPDGYRSIHSAETLIIVESCPMVHPQLFSKLRNGLKPRSARRDTIVWLSRKRTHCFYPQRFISNEDDVVSMLQRVFTRERVVVYDHKRFSFSETLELFSRAKAMIGAHGGAFYNQFYAPRQTVIVEILPVTRHGLYPDQPSAERTPSFSHMAVWSNSLLLGQPFWRFYAIAHRESFEVNVSSLENLLRTIPSLRVTSDEL